MYINIQNLKACMDLYIEVRSGLVVIMLLIRSTRVKWIKRKIIMWLFGYDFPRYVRQFYKEQDQVRKLYSDMLHEEERLLRWIKLAEEKR
jgi:hypothetical protein|nr:MAG TPA: hypothetical protein [Caudoviricetes sp.]